jgi:hypothetical protein
MEFARFYSRTMSFASLSVRSPKKTGRRSWSSDVHSVNLTWATSTGLTHWHRFMTAGVIPRPICLWFFRQIYKRTRWLPGQSFLRLRRPKGIMTSDEFHEMAEECSYEFEGAQRDAPLTLSRLAQLERQKGVRFPAFYKEFLSMYGPEILVVFTV